MSEEKPKTKLEEIEARRAKKREAHNAARDEQRAVDLEALEKFEDEHGYGKVMSLDVTSFVEGFPTMAIVRSPGGTPYYGRYKARIQASKQKVELINKAQEELGESCLLYPEGEEERKAFFAEFPGAKLSAGVVAMRLVEQDAADEKKG